MDRKKERKRKERKKKENKNKTKSSRYPSLFVFHLVHYVQTSKQITGVYMRPKLFYGHRPVKNELALQNCNPPLPPNHIGLQNKHEGFCRYCFAL